MEKAATPLCTHLLPRSNIGGLKGSQPIQEYTIIARIVDGDEMGHRDTVCSSALPCPAEQTRAYTITTIDPAGAVTSEAYSLNDSGHVVVKLKLRRHG